jgi:hypothetical protein
MYQPLQAKKKGGRKSRNIRDKCLQKPANDKEIEQDDVEDDDVLPRLNANLFI